MLNKKFGLCSDSVKVLLYKLFCANFYCGSLWCDFTQSVYNKIRVSYNNSFRILLKLPKFCSASEMFVYSDVPNFETLLRKQRYSLMTRIKIVTIFLFLQYLTQMCFLNLIFFPCMRHLCQQVRLFEWYYIHKTNHVI